MVSEGFRHRTRPEGSIARKLTVSAKREGANELEDGPKSSRPDAAQTSVPSLGLWLIATYVSFGAWLAHSFAVRFFLFSVQRLLVKFLARE